jgi:hypothetical protein
MARNLQIDANLNAADQIVRDQSGGASRLALSTEHITIYNPGDGNVLLVLGAERSWNFKQISSGATTALELTAADPNDYNKSFIINTDGRVGIGTTHVREDSVHRR